MTTNFFLKSKMPKILYPLYLEYKYHKMTGKKCNLSNPTTYTEKIQWAKLHRDNKVLALYADKIKVRDYVASTIGENHLVPLVGKIYESADEIDFDILPNKFVIKANHGSGFNFIVTDKSKIEIDKVRTIVNSWLKRNIAYTSLELQYKYIKPQIYIEKYLVPDGEIDLPDYKFFCFDGKVYCSYTMTDYLFEHKNGRLGFFDRDYNLLPYHRDDYFPIETQLDKPRNYAMMLEIAEKLSKGFSHVRVDLYNIAGDIKFGEMTFSTNSGYCRFVPDEFDEILGNQWDLFNGI